MKLVKADRLIHRVEADNGKIVGLSMLLANGRWGAFSPKEERLTQVGISFEKSSDVFKFFQLTAKGVRP